MPRDLARDPRYNICMPVRRTTRNETDTAAFAAELAKDARTGDVFLLEGPLGAGKSVFARGFVQFCAGSNIDVPSPTYTLVQTYDTPRGTIHHFDLYRIEDAEEIFELGWEDALSDGISLVEWPSRLGPYTPKGAKMLRFLNSADTREIVIDDQ